MSLNPCDRPGVLLLFYKEEYEAPIGCCIFLARVLLLALSFLSNVPTAGFGPHLQMSLHGFSQACIRKGYCSSFQQISQLKGV